MEVGGEKTGEYEGEEDIILVSGDIETNTEIKVGWEKTGEYKGEDTSGNMEMMTEMDVGGEKTGKYEGEYEDATLMSGDIEMMTEMDVWGEKMGEYKGGEEVSLHQSSNGSGHASDIAAFPITPSPSRATDSISKSKSRTKKPKTTITDYFKATKALKPRGRPKKRKQKNNHAIADSPIDIPIEMRKRPPEELVTAEPEINPPVPPAPGAMQKRINWGKPGPHRDKMLRAIDHWLNDGVDRFDDNGERITDYKTYANVCGIPSMSLYRYIHPDVSKRIHLGDGCRGKEKLLTDEEVLFLGHYLRE